MSTLLLYDDGFLEHDPGPDHPESPMRLRAIRRALDQLPSGCRWGDVRPATQGELERVHLDVHVAALARTAGHTVQLDPDTVTSPGSHLAALRAAGAAVTMVDALVDGEVDNAFALVRPPGHHAEAAYAMGFCLFNNVAVAAEHARSRGVERVAIVDWDVHHGNGTQHVFEHRRDVLFISLHQFPFYPGTGAAHEVGRGAGAGYTMNIPFAAGMRDGDYGAAFGDLVGPALESFRPGMVLVSAGFDAHRRDPLGEMELTEEGFGAMCSAVRDAARHARAPLGLVLEGGYDLEALSASARRCVEVLAGERIPLRTDAGARGAEALRAVRDAHRGSYVG